MNVPCHDCHGTGRIRTHNSYTGIENTPCDTCNEAGELSLYELMYES